MKTENKTESTCNHKLKCEHCKKEFKPLHSFKIPLPEKDNRPNIYKESHVSVNIHIQPERKGIFKWLAGLVW